MPMGNVMGSLYNMSDWVMRLVYVNLLWIGFSGLGLLLFGIGPATSAMFTITRKWVRGEDDVKVFAHFWQTYKKDFVKANFLTLLLFLGGCLIYLDFQFVYSLEGWLTSVFSGILVLVTMLYFVTVIFVFPVFVYFEMKLLQYIKFAIHLGVSSPLSIVGIFGSLVVMYYLTLFIPAIFLFFSGSVICFVIMYLTERSFKKLENKYIGMAS